LCKAGNPQEHAKVAIKIMLERAGLFRFFGEDGILLWLNLGFFEKGINEGKEKASTSDSQCLYVGYSKKVFTWLSELFPQLGTVSICRGHPNPLKNGLLAKQGEIRGKCGL
jgi:hypothetical protein